MVKTAIILAAGRGTRLKELGKEIPKGFLQIGEKPIIVESLEKLFAAGIERVVIVTGHCAEKYEELARSWTGQLRVEAPTGGRDSAAGFDAGVEALSRKSSTSSVPLVTVHNDRYADSGSLYSLYLAGIALEGEDPEGFLLLESDLIYEKRALDILLRDPRPDLVLVSGRTHSGDEVWVATEGENLRALSKDRSRLEAILTRPSKERQAKESSQQEYVAKEDEPPKILGELVGISKISATLYSLLSETAERLFEQTLHVEYETGLMETAKHHPIPCLLIPNLVWAEIDDGNHLERAKGLYRSLSYLFP